MEIREVRVRNIRSFEKATLHLGAGTSLLWGDVGAGKTSLLHAIEMALFGFSEVDPAHLIRHGATTAEVALTLSDGSHEYVFTRRFHRKMRRGRDLFETDEKGTGLSTDGVLTRYPATELRQRAIDLLGFPDNPNPRAHSDLWRWAVYVPQERMRQILEGEDADARLETVRKALGLERYRTAAENAKLVAHELRRDAVQQAEQAELLEHWESDLLEGEAALRSAERAREEAGKAEAAGRRTVAEGAERLEVAEHRARRLEADRRELVEVGSRLEELSKRTQARTERIARLLARDRDLAQEIERLEKLSATSADLAARLEAQTRSVAELHDGVERAQSARREFEVAEARRQELAARTREEEGALARAVVEQARTTEALATLDRERSLAPAPEEDGRSLGEIESALAQAIADSESAAGEVRRWEGVLSETDDLIARGVCPRCGQTVTSSSFEGHRAEVRRALATAREAYARSTERRTAIGAERAAREARDRARLAREGIERRQEVARADAHRSEVERARIEGQLDARRWELAETEASVARTSPPALELASLQRRWKAATSDLARLQAEAAEAGRSDPELRLRREALEGVRNEVAAARSEEGPDRTRVGELTERREHLGREVDGAGVLEAELRELSASLATARAAVELSVGRLHRAEGDAEAARRRIGEARTRVRERERLQRTSKELEETGGFLTGPFRDAMLELEHRLLARAKVEFDRSFGRYFAALIEDPSLVARSDPRFDPSVEIDGELTPPEALSGGERTALALAFRLALGDVVRSLDRLNLSTLILDEPTDGFSPEQVQRMGELLSELGLPQVILVSHEAALNGIADRVVRIRKVGGCSEVVDPGGAPTPVGPVALQE
ncbi:MAG TPA: SMC family ATPase [Thermoplasmata archaeon]|nr:SMC family ATPase [Thermoplasmata archaeon]